MEGFGDLGWDGLKGGGERDLRSFVCFVDFVAMHCGLIASVVYLSLDSIEVV